MLGESFGGGVRIFMFYEHTRRNKRGRRRDKMT